MFASGKVLPSAGDVHQVSYGDDSGLFVEFYWREVKNEAKSLAEGRPIFESKEYVKIIAAGDKTKWWDRPVQKVSNGVTPSDIDRFPRAWAAFQRQGVEVTEGTPIIEWPQITRSDAAMLKSHGVHTIEACAALSDMNLGNILGGRKYRDMAQAWLVKAKDGAAAAQWAKEKEHMQAQLDAMKNQIEGLTLAGAMPKQEASAPPAKRGRKPKVKDEQDISGTNPSGS